MDVSRKVCAGPDHSHEQISVLSTFEESVAECISDMSRQATNGKYLDAMRMAEKFILHVEVLFATIEDLESSFARMNMKGACYNVPRHALV